MGYMRGVVIKPNRSKDEYILWSSVVDGPVWGPGTRTELLAGLWKEWNIEHEHCTPHPGYGPEGRVQRADSNGSSIRTDETTGIFGGWDDKELVVQLHYGFGLVKREHLAEYTRLLAEGQTEKAEMLAEPIVPEKPAD